MRKDEKWKWGEEQQAAFKQLKAVFTTRLVLATPELDKEFRVEADASNFATGGVLSVKYDNCHKPPLWLSLFLLFFSLLFYFLFIAWESLSHYVTQGVTMSHQKGSHHGHITRSHSSVGK